MLQRFYTFCELYADISKLDYNSTTRSIVNFSVCEILQYIVFNLSYFTVLVKGIILRLHCFCPPIPSVFVVGIFPALRSFLPSKDMCFWDHFAGLKKKIPFSWEFACFSWHIAVITAFISFCRWELVICNTKVPVTLFAQPAVSRKILHIEMYAC